MNSADDLRQRFAAGNLQTASATKVVTMCFDRLERDLATARSAIGRGDHFVCNEVLGHAQDLVCELALMLEPELWEHAGSLLALYDYLLRVLTAANTTKDVGLVGEAHRIVGELGEAFRTAAERAPDAGGFAGTPGDSPDRVERPVDPHVDPDGDASGTTRLSLRA